MDIFFLSADKPIRKGYELTKRGNLRKIPYPHVHRFKSFRYNIANIEDLEMAIRGHASGGNCLVKGNLLRDLDMESRAGSTSPDTPTKWICLDFDGVCGFDQVSGALDQLDIGDTDYILQYSASHGVDDPSFREIRCHVFMLLDDDHHPEMLKRWLKYLNLTYLKDQLQLAKSGNSLLWPLDITTCQNDKLLYIAPPIFGEGITDPCTGDERITLVKSKHRALELDLRGLPEQSELRALELATINELREQLKLPRRRHYRFNYDSGVEYLDKPNEAEITGIKTERGFVYLNLNGGDSWGYFHPVDNPAFIHNFKGEPVYRTEDLLPSYWAKIRSRNESLQPNQSGRVYLAFRDFSTATYWNGVYDSASDSILKLAQAKSESQLRHFMKQHGQPIGDFIPDWDLVFDPSSTKTLDSKRKRINIFSPSKYFLRATPNTQPDLSHSPTIERLINHVVGGEQAVVEHLLNWLAVIVQHKTMTGTAWVLHGTQGTGKGLLFNYVFTPIFGKDNVVSKRMEELGSEFTDFMKNKFVVFIDEVQSGKTLYHEKISAKLKNLIVEPRISVREMYKPAALHKNYSNLVFASNSQHPVYIAPDDRRFNVAKYQTQRIRINDADIHQIEKELGTFYDYLSSRKADAHIARTPIFTADKQRIIDVSRSTIDMVIDALKDGDFDYFKDQITDQPELINPSLLVIHDQFSALLAEIESTQRNILTRDELMLIFRWCVGKIPDTPNKFTSMCRHHGLEMSVVWVDNKSQRGFKIEPEPNKGWTFSSSAPSQSELST